MRRPTAERALARAARLLPLSALPLLAGLAMPISPAFAADPADAADTPAAPAAPADPYLWLEDVASEPALAWARARNAETARALESTPAYAERRRRLLAVYDQKERIPDAVRHGERLYNFWQDEKNPRGLLRRATLADYRQADVPWETVLDLDALGAAENVNWTWHGMSCLGPAYRRCLVQLSRGGADAAVVREFDLAEKRFVADDAFALPEAKSSVEWIDLDTLYVATDFGDGSLTDSGYPRVVKRWRRGTPLAAAETVFSGEKSDVAVGVSVDRTPGYERTLFERNVDFYNARRFLLVEGRLVPFDVPDDARVAFMRDALLLQLRSDATFDGERHAAGSLLAATVDGWLAGRRTARALFTPTPSRSLDGWSTTRDHVLLRVLDRVATRIEEWKKEGTSFTRRVVAAPYPGTIRIDALYDPLLDGVPAEGGRRAVPARGDGALAERYWFTYVDFLTPDSLSLASAGDDRREALKQRPPLFDADGMRVEQAEATSKDGTRIPYFVVLPKTRAAGAPRGDAPTLLYGYGGFEVSLDPFYSPSKGAEWLAQGGVFVVANIRGGGEFGPAWHQAAIKAGKQKSYDDFIAVAEDLVARRITSPKHLGIEGGSNGGLLVGAVMTQRPDLFGAVVCEAPLLDMRRYSKLLAGASWMGEYGDPDVPADWATLSRYSPYQNLRPGVTYPPVLFTTSTRDDRVHPGHARKMAARMLAAGQDVLFYENIEGGHAGAADNAQIAHLNALVYTFLWQRLAPPP